MVTSPPDRLNLTLVARETIVDCILQAQLLSHFRQVEGLFLRNRLPIRANVRCFFTHQQHRTCGRRLYCILQTLISIVQSDTFSVWQLISRLGKHIFFRPFVQTVIDDGLSHAVNAHVDATDIVLLIVGHGLAVVREVGVGPVGALSELEFLVGGVIEVGLFQIPRLGNWLFAGEGFDELGAELVDAVWLTRSYSRSCQSHWIFVRQAYCFLYPLIFVIWHLLVNILR